MNVLRAIVAAGSLIGLACGSAEPDLPLILGAQGPSTAPGPRTLTASESRALQRKITVAHEPCESISQAYLRDITAGAEAWEVRCREGAYSILLSSDSAPVVRRCVEAPMDDPPCFVPGPGYRSGYGRRSRNPGPLNPELGKLLEPMTTKAPETD
jgi:hypothetical protein